MYEFTSRVRYSEIRPDGTMSVGSLIRRMQDCSVFHSESIGRGPEFWLESGYGWMIVSWQIALHAMPRFGMPVTTKTWSYRFRGIEGDRNFVVLDEDGRLLAEANSIWIYFDLNAQKPIRVPDEEMNGFGVEEPLSSFSNTKRKIALPPVWDEEMEPLHVQPMNIDTNGHVNNLVYIEMALEYVPADFFVREIRVQYLAQARMGDAIIPRCFRDESRLLVALGAPGGENYAVAEFLS